jgi:hypothetical protein
MDAELLQRVLNLAERTGDRMIIVNPESGEAHAVMPLDAYEELVDGDVGLRELSEWAGDNEETPVELDDFMSEPEIKIVPEKTAVPAPAIKEEELEKLVQHDLEIIKLAEQGQKEVEVNPPLDALEDEADEEQYYLEPLE